MSEMPFTNPLDPVRPPDIPPIDDPHELPEIDRREPEMPPSDPIDVPAPPHEPNDPHPLDQPTIGDPLPFGSPVGDPPPHQPTITA